MVDKYSIPWCYGVCGCTGSPFLKQLKVLLGSDEALEEEGLRVDPSSTVLSRQVDPSPMERSGATVNLSSPSWSLFPLSLPISLSLSVSPSPNLSVSLFSPFLSPLVPQIFQVRAGDLFCFSSGLGNDVVALMFFFW